MTSRTDDDNNKVSWIPVESYIEFVLQSDKLVRDLCHVNHFLERPSRLEQHMLL